MAQNSRIFLRLLLWGILRDFQRGEKWVFYWSFPLISWVIFPFCRKKWDFSMKKGNAL